MTEHPDISALSAHLDGELDGAGTARISSHLLSCPPCQYQYRALRELSQDLQRLPAFEPRLDMATLIDQLPERPQRGRLPSQRLLPGVAAAAALALGLFIGSGLHSPSIETGAPTFAALAILDSTPPGALCRQPELCYLMGNPQ